jgi:hypothetical protein
MKALRGVLVGHLDSLVAPACDGIPMNRVCLIQIELRSFVSKEE